MLNLKKITFLLVLFGVSYSGWAEIDEKIKGVSFVGSNEPISAKNVNPIIAVNANWVTLMPYGFVGKDGIVQFNSQWQWWGEKEEGIKKTIELCQAAKLKIMLKPQIWLMKAYTGDFTLPNDESWQKFEDSYQKFILFFIDIAQTYNVELFCIGTEWRSFIKARPTFWNQLIKQVKNHYDGALTYAANWDDYQDVPFWNEMDYVGVNGYFPISYSKNPSLKELVKGWTINSEKLEQFSSKTDRKILFTEIGYRSIEGGTIKPWEHHTHDKYSGKLQDLAYQALFQVVWKKDWLKGMFVWKWYHNHSNRGGEGDLDFTPQNKPAEETIKKYWQESD